MMRTVLIVCLTAASVTTALAGLFSFFTTIDGTLYAGHRKFLAGWICDGHCALVGMTTNARDERRFADELLKRCCRELRRSPEWCRSFRFKKTALGAGKSMVILVFTLAFPTVLSAAYPMVVLVRGPLLRCYRSRRGCCAFCGYNLTGNQSGVCPECGR